MLALIAAMSAIQSVTGVYESLYGGAVVPYKHIDGVPPPQFIYRHARCEYCAMNDFAHNQCQRCGAPQR